MLVLPKLKIFEGRAPCVKLNMKWPFSFHTLKYSSPYVSSSPLNIDDMVIFFNCAIAKNVGSFCRTQKIRAQRRRQSQTPIFPVYIHHFTCMHDISRVGVAGRVYMLYTLYIYMPRIAALYTHSIHFSSLIKPASH